MVLKIDGTDIVPYIAYGGVKWQRSDVDSEDEFTWSHIESLTDYLNLWIESI